MRILPLLAALCALVPSIWFPAHGAELVKKWSVGVYAVTSVYVEAVGRDYSALLSVSSPTNGGWLWVSGEGAKLLEPRDLPSGTGAGVFSVSSSNLAMVLFPPVKFRLFSVIGSSVASKDFDVPGTFAQTVDGNGAPHFFAEAMTRRPEPYPVIVFTNNTISCYVLDGPDLYPKPTLTVPAINGATADVKVSNPTDAVVSLDASNDLKGWTVIKRIEPSPSPVTATVASTNTPGLFLRVREE